MLYQADKAQFFQDRYQAVILPVPCSGVFAQRQLLHYQRLYPEFYAAYRHACKAGELALGDILVYRHRHELLGMGVPPAHRQPSYTVALAVTEFAQHPSSLEAIKQGLQRLEPLLYDWGRYQGIRRVALLAANPLLRPTAADFEQTIEPLLTKFLQPVSSLSVVVYR